MSVVGVIVDSCGSDIAVSGEEGGGLDAATGVFKYHCLLCFHYRSANSTLLRKYDASNNSSSVGAYQKVMTRQQGVVVPTGSTLPPHIV